MYWNHGNQEHSPTGGNRQPSAALKDRGRDSHERTGGASEETPADQQRVLRKHDREHVGPTIAHSAEQRQLAPPLEDIPHHNCGQPDGSHEQTKAAERLKR